MDGALAQAAARRARRCEPACALYARKRAAVVHASGDRPVEAACIARCRGYDADQEATNGPCTDAAWRCSIAVYSRLSKKNGDPRSNPSPARKIAVVTPMLSKAVLPGLAAKTAVALASVKETVPCLPLMPVLSADSASHPRQGGLETHDRQMTAARDARGVSYALRRAAETSARCLLRPGGSAAARWCRALVHCRRPARRRGHGHALPCRGCRIRTVAP